MRYVRQVKKNPKDALNSLERVAAGGKDNPQNYNFPELEEYFVYNPGNTKTGAIASSFTGGSSKGVKMTRDSVTYCTSGLVDRNKGSTLSWLHKSIKPLNQLMMIEDLLVIYRLSILQNVESSISTVTLPKVGQNNIFVMS